MEAIWKEVKAGIKLRISGYSFRTWIDSLKLIKCDSDHIVLSAPNPFSKKRVLNNYGALIESEIKKVTGKACRILIEVSKTKPLPRPEADKDLQLSLPNINVHRHRGQFLRKNFTFDQFVVGSNNDLAYSASLSLASKKNTQLNSLFLLSNNGMGKSHLSQSIGRHILSQFPSERIYYNTAEDFSNEMIHAFRHDSISAFKEKYRGQCDVLLLEDVHHLSGKDRTQIELALILDKLMEADKKIVFSSCYLPADIPKLHEKLRSLFSCGLVSIIDPPNFNTRVRILWKKVKFNGYEMPEDVIHYLASELTEDVRQLESGLIGVNVKSSLLGTPINLLEAESVVKNIVRRRKNITLDVIKKLVSKQYNISVNEIVSKSRKQSVARPRQIAMYLSRRYTDSPLKTIGKSFNRYHATALYSINTIEQAIKENGPIKKHVEFLRQKLESNKF